MVWEYGLVIRWVSARYIDRLAAPFLRLFGCWNDAHPLNRNPMGTICGEGVARWFIVPYVSGATLDESKFLREFAHDSGQMFPI
jgi:hypothetical protein